MRRPAVLAACAALAAVSLAIPAALTFDAWAWLVWGREVGGLALDTTGGPSWKPLPVVFATFIAPLGATAVPVWMVIARTGALLALAGSYRLASRVAGPWAGVVAAALLVLGPDGDPRFLRLFGEGHVAPAAAACALFAVEFHLDGRRSGALVLGLGAALLRPEAWPFLGVYALWLWWRDDARRPLVAAVLLAVPVLWFGPDHWGSGSALNGAGSAQVASDASVAARTLEALTVAAQMVPVPAWVGAAIGLRSARRPDERWLHVLAGAALAWSLVVVLMATALGYAALSRFFLPAAAAVCILAGIGSVRAVAELRRRNRSALAIAAVVGGLFFALPRIVGIPAVVGDVVDRGRAEGDLDRVLDTVGADALLACDDLAVDGVGLLRTGVAWKLDVPMHAVGLDLDREAATAAGVELSGVMIVRADGPRDRAISRQDHTETVLRSAEWVVLAINCPSALPDA